MLNWRNRPQVSTWSVRISPPVQGDAGWRARALELIRPEVERRLLRCPTERQFTLRGPLLQAEIQREAGDWRPGAEIRLRYADPAAGLPTSNGTAATTPPLVSITLPDDRLERLGERLVGLDRVREEVLLRLHCHWDAGLETWSERTRRPVPPAVRALFEERVPLFNFTGDPGVGKSALAQVIADRYCRDVGTSGHLFWVGTDVRGNGLVGDFGNRLRATFAAVARISGGTEPCFVVIDEADSIAMRRSETHAHQEDRAGTATLLQSLDALGGERRLAIFLTTNLPETVDAAVRRRGTSYRFPRPGLRARWRLMAQLWPEADGRLLAWAAALSRGMTPADIECAVGHSCLEAIRRGTTPAITTVTKHLLRQSRTGRV
jgi:ATPase family associated with various cellular activities (AAA)